MIEITALYCGEQVRWNEETAVLSAMCEGRPLSVICDCSKGELDAGNNYRFSGDFQTHKKYGKQFRASAYVMDVPVGKEATIVFLMRFPGIGKKTAADIFSKFGAESLDIIVENPMRLHHNFPRIPAVDAIDIAEKIKSELVGAKTLIELAGYLTGSGFPRETAKRFFKKYGAKSLFFVRRNPYLLLHFDGCGFTSVDKFALKNGFPPLRTKRQALFLLDKMGDSGDVWFGVESLKNMLIAQFGAGNQFKRVMCILKRSKKIESQKIDDVWWIATKSDSENEAEISSQVQCHMVENEPVEMDTSDLSESQSVAIREATRHKIGCFVGGPGTGKTYSVARYIRAVVEKYGAASITVVAPTGKAVVRSREMLASIGVAVSCCTLHSLLMRQELDPCIQYKFIISDESSMIDAELMTRFLRNNQDAAILFVGDDGQLLPVGKGRPLADFLASGAVPTGRLTKPGGTPGALWRRVTRSARVFCGRPRRGWTWRPAKTS